VRRRLGPFLCAQLNCVSRALEIRTGSHRSFFAPQNTQLPPFWGENLPQEVDGLGVPHTGAVLGCA
jgi:hypothetical protein